MRRAPATIRMSSNVGIHPSRLRLRRCAAVGTLPIYPPDQEDELAPFHHGLSAKAALRLARISRHELRAKAQTFIVLSVAMHESNPFRFAEGTRGPQDRTSGRRIFLLRRRRIMYDSLPCFDATCRHRMLCSILVDKLC